MCGKLASRNEGTLCSWTLQIWDVDGCKVLLLPNCPRIGLGRGKRVVKQHRSDRKRWFRPSCQQVNASALQQHFPGHCFRGLPFSRHLCLHSPVGLVDRPSSRNQSHGSLLQDSTEKYHFFLISSVTFPPLPPSLVSPISVLFDYPTREQRVNFLSIIKNNTDIFKNLSGRNNSRSPQHRHLLIVTKHTLSGINYLFFLFKCDPDAAHVGLHWFCLKERKHPTCCFISFYSHYKRYRRTPWC